MQREALIMYLLVDHPEGSLAARKRGCLHSAPFGSCWQKLP
jgi:hypothetical protein